MTQTDADHIYDADGAYGIHEKTEQISSTRTITQLILANRLYLDGTKTSDGNGTADNPFNNLTSALSAGSSWNNIIIVTGTVPLSGEYSASLVATVQRGIGFTAPMFTVADGASVRLNRFNISGRGTGTLVQTNGGSLILSGGLLLENCDIAINMVGGSVTVTQTIINANVYSIRMDEGAGTLEMNALAVTSLAAPVYLANGKYMTATRTLANISSGVKVECETFGVGTRIVVGSGYNLRNTDVASVIPVDRAYGVFNSSNQLLLTESHYIFLDGTAPSGGNGSETTPYNSLAKALENINDDSVILVKGTVALENTTYGEAVTIERDAALTGPMFTLNIEDADTIFKSMTIAGEGIDTMFEVSNGTLEFNGGVTLLGSGTAIDVKGGHVAVAQATVSAAEYSVKLENSNATFTLTPDDGERTVLDGTIYLADNTYIDCGARLTRMENPIIIVCENPEVGKLVAQRNSAFQSSEAAKVVYLDSEYGIARSTTNTSQLVLTSVSKK
jgi:hypothetical protein